MEQNENVDWSALHTVEEMQHLSNVGHWIEGGLFALVSVIAILQATGALKVVLFWPSTIVIAGLFLVGYLLLHHGLQNVPLVWSLILKDGQQRQHLVMAILLCIAGLSEIVGSLKNISWLNYAWPSAILIIGIMFLIHEQHGTSHAVELAQRIHKYLGVILILVAISIVLNIQIGLKYRFLNFLWPSLLILVAALLILYREPKGAFHPGGSDKKMDHSE